MKPDKTTPMHGFYKQVEPKADKGAWRATTVREAVAKFGDDWRMCIDHKSPFWSEIGDNEGPDWKDAAKMRLMEKGDLPRLNVSSLYTHPDDRDPVHIEHVYPPIPERCWDYAAYRDPEGPIGRGGTPFIAINDLIEKESER